MNYLISLLPVLIYFLVIKGLDGFSLVKWSKLISYLLWGAVACVGCFFLGRVIPDNSGLLFPLVEEFVKILPLLLAIALKYSAFLTESVSYGAAVGTGFAILENTMYVALSTDFTLGDALLRGFGTSLLHIGCTALAASVAMLSYRQTVNKSGIAKILLFSASILPSYIIHAVYNLFLLPEYVQMLITIVVIIFLIIGIYALDERLINKWLDLCISNDIMLLNAIKKGNLRETRAGKYLSSAKEKFKPEVFFDICVFLGLYLEVTIAAKSRMIMREAGIDTPLDPEEHKKNENKLLELENLKKTIGPSGIMFLRPIVNTKTVDEWVMKELL